MNLGACTLRVEGLSLLFDVDCDDRPRDRHDFRELWSPGGFIFEKLVEHGQLAPDGRVLCECITGGLTVRNLPGGGWLATLEFTGHPLTASA